MEASQAVEEHQARVVVVEMAPAMGVAVARHLVDKAAPRAEEVLVVACMVEGLMAEVADSLVA